MKIKEIDAIKPYTMRRVETQDVSGDMYQSWEIYDTHNKVHYSCTSPDVAYTLLRKLNTDGLS